MSGTFSDTFLLKIFLKTIDSVSSDSSTPNIMLYFYENSNEINIYFEKYLKNFGDYSFQIYQSEISTKYEESNLEITQEIKNVTVNEEEKENFLIKIKRLRDKFKLIDYFFL